MKKNNLIDKAHLFVPTGKFIVRTPLLTLEDFFRLSASEDIIPLLKTYYENPLIKEAILIASQDLYGSLEKQKNGGLEDKKNSSFSSLLKYLLRMSTRATPFGLFSSVSTGSFDQSTSFFLDHVDTVKKRIRPDMEWLNHIVEGFEKDLEAVKCLRVISNPLSYRSGKRLFLDDRIASGESKKTTISIRTSYLTDYIFESAKRPIPLQELLDSTCKSFPKLDVEKIAYLIESLFRQKFIISELTPALLTADPFQVLLGRLSTSHQHGNLYPQLKEIDDIIKAYNLTSPGEGIASIEAILDKMKQMKESSHYIQVDSAHLQDQLKLNRSVGSEISLCAEVMWKLFSPQGSSYLENYHRRFLDKYGFMELVPIQQLVDENSGLGLKYQDRERGEGLSSTSSEFQRYLKNSLVEAYMNGSHELALPEELPFLKDKDPLKSPLSFEIYCDILASSQESLDHGDFTILFHSLSGQGGSTIGRFADILHDTGENLMRDIFEREQELEPHTCFVESSYLPPKPRFANVAIHPNFRDFEINLNFPTGQEERMIGLDDIYIGANSERLYLISKRLDRELNVTFSNMLNPAFAPPILRLMRDISKQQYQSIRLWDWENLADFPFLPRVRYKRVILSPARWRINLDTLKLKNQKDEKLIESALRKWLEKWRVPRFVYLTFLDNKILLDLENSAHFTEMVHELKNKYTMMLTESHIEGHQWVKSPKGAHSCEFVIPFIRNPVYSNEKKIAFPPRFEAIDQIHKHHPPGGEWLYAKIYFPENKQEEFICQQLASFAETLISDKLADSWFYIRYAENEDGHHIRLRIHGEPAKLSEKVLPRLHEWTMGLIQAQQIRTIELGNYEREIYRYGGPCLIEKAERVFAADSQACALLLNCFSEKEYGFPLYALAALNILDLLHRLGFSLNQQLEIFELIDADKKHLEGFKAHGQAIIQMSFWIFKDGMPPPDQIAHEWMSYLNIRHPFLKQYREAMLEEGTGMWSTPFNIYQSLIHMHCNRLMGTDLEKEKKAIAYAHHILLKLKYLFKEQSEKLELFQK